MLGAIRMKNGQITIPSVLFAGQGSSEKLAEILAKENVKNVLIFTDRGIRGAGLTKGVEALCGEAASVTVVDDLTAEPAVADIERVLGEVREKPELIVGVGGGSVMDAAKLASIIVGAPYTLMDPRGQRYREEADEDGHAPDDMRNGV